ncbi:MAG TPA: UDP-glucose/GDP-mannose dehydrogenase family protein [candidate division WOR-3 bacterium]|uniref:UDP-glucose 6-dehydrogenase n=1 Tax=candidate division WOR-3 bacterium TaxID=2052148 RepID=A0A9C9JZG1_UNCW3|nr:UDP-glucose/GDP-mannose dehydrogenase family protein [candidate division WOR-3 bacterium]
MKVCMIGTGYVGLVSGTCFAEIGHDVICVDNDQKKIDILKKGGVPIYEPGLKEMINRNVAAGRLRFTTSIREGVENSLFLFIAVGTPPKEDGEPDLTSVEKVAEEIGAAMTEYKIIIEKSTVPVRTGEWVRTVIERFSRKVKKFDVASNPEFLREGSAINDFLSPDRIVLGVESKEAEEKLLELYKPIDAPKIVTDLASAELIKHASNAFLSTKISFINAISIICEKSGADVLKVAEGVGLDKRIGRAFLNAGVGFGGFCFPKDLKAFISIAAKLGYDFNLLKEVDRINNEQMLRVVTKLEEVLWNLKDKEIGVLGLAFKPNTDDMRFAPSITIIRELQKHGAKIRGYDPVAMERARTVMPDIRYCSDAYEVAKDADAIVLVTEWDEFRKLDLERVKNAMRQPVFLDGRNVFEPEEMKKRGFIYTGIGR